MVRNPHLALALSAALATTFAAPAPVSKRLSPDVASIVDAEHAFCRMALSHGMREAFLSYLADDAIMFRPEPVNGVQLYRDRPASPGLLSWEPVFAEVAGTGDLGFTTGPWEFRRDSASAPAAYGDYVSVWRRLPHRPWKLAVDLGVDHERPDHPPAALAFPAGGRAPSRVPGSKAIAMIEKVGLLQVERMMAEDAAVRGFDTAFVERADDDVRLFRSNLFPAVGKQAALAALADSMQLKSWQPLGAELSHGSDLGYTYGTGELAPRGESPGDSASYVRIWRRAPDRQWKIALDIALPIPRSVKR